MIRRKVIETISRERMLSPSEVLCVAFSGGPDSTALLYILHELKNELGIGLAACHVNHGLRGDESEEDEIFCRETARELSIPIYVKRVNVKRFMSVKGATLQEAARELRYLFFKRIIASGMAHKVAIAHTADDGVETFLINLLRGTGLSGLSGIAPVRENRFIRPLIEVGKEDLLEYLSRNGISYRQDSSNLQDKYTRNKIRQRVIPLLEEVNPSLRKAISRTSSIMGEVGDFIRIEAEEAFKKIAVFSGAHEVDVDCGGFALLHTALQKEVARCVVEHVRGNILGISFDNLEILRKLAIKREGGGEVSFPGFSAALAHGRLYCVPMPRKPLPSFEYPFTGCGTFGIDELGIDVVVGRMSPPVKEFDPGCGTVYLDEDRLPKNAVFRNRREGDRFTPLGGRGSRKLKEFFIDSKVARWERDSVLLLAAGKEVLWIGGYRISEAAKIGPDTKSVLRMQIVERR